MEDKKVELKDIIQNGINPPGVVIYNDLKNNLDTIQILINKYPNDMDLGRVVRSMFSKTN